MYTKVIAQRRGWLAIVIVCALALSAKAQVLWQTPSETSIVAFSPDGQTITAANGATIERYSLTGALLQTRALDQSDYNNLRLSPGGNFLYGQRVSCVTIGGRDYCSAYARIWRTDTGASVKDYAYDWELGPVLSPLGFTPDEKLCAVSMLVNCCASIELISTASGARLHALYIPKGVFAPIGITASQFSPNGQYLMTAHDNNSVILWAVNAGSQRFIVSTESTKPTALAISPDGLIFALGVQETRQLTSIQFRRMSDGEIIDTLGPFTGEIRSMQYCSDGSQLLYSISHYDTNLGAIVTDVTLRQLDTMSVVTNVSRAGEFQAKFAPDGKSFALTGSLNMFRCADGSMVCPCNRNAGNGLDNSAYSSDSRYVAYTSAGAPRTLSLLHNPANRVPGDTDLNHCVDDFDLAHVIYDFGGAPSGDYGFTDLTGNGMVDDFDLAQVIFHFGEGCN